jgi:tol-pal system protein YbgF
MRMRNTLAMALTFAATQVVAQVAPVEDLGGGYQSTRQSSQRQPVAAPAAPAPAPANQAVIDLHYEVQSMRDEIRQLRGIVEEQANELRELRQRQMDDYQDLDRRLSARSDAAPVRPASPAPSFGSQPPQQQSQVQTQSQSPGYTTSTLPPGLTPASNPADEQAEQQAYTASYNLLKARKIDEAVAGFKKQVAKYPNGKFTANAYYWLGEIHLLQNNLPEAENAFAMVTTNFPAHRKAADASFKLAKVYHQQGKTDQAKVLLQKVASGNSSAAPLAQAYLSDNF